MNLHTKPESEIHRIALKIFFTPFIVFAAVAFVLFLSLSSLSSEEISIEEYKEVQRLTEVGDKQIDELIDECMSNGKISKSEYRSIMRIAADKEIQSIKMNIKQNIKE